MGSRLITTLLLALLWPGIALGHGDEHAHGNAKRKKGKGRSAKATSHEHSSWQFSLGAGVSTSYPLTKNEPKEEEASDAAGGSALLDEGHDHGSGGEGSEGGASEDDPKLSPYVSASVQYMVSHSVGLGLAAGYGLEGGLFDPTIFVSYTTKLSKRMSLPVSLGASLPVSESSREKYKITTISLAGGPQYRVTKAVSIGLQASASFSWYSRTVVITGADEEDGATGSLRLLDEGHDHTGGDSGGNVGSDIGEGGTGDREFNRYSAKLLGTYRLSKAFQLGSAVGVSLVKRQFSAATLNLDATLIQVTYNLP